MRARFGFILLVIFGSFCVYCAQNVVGGGNGGNGNGGSGGGMVGSAGADTCCTPPDPPAGTVLYDQKVTPTVENGLCVSPAIDVSGNRTIVVHGPSSTNMQWSFGGAAGWVYKFNVNPSSEGVLVLDGRMGKQFRFVYGNASSPCSQIALTVVGYKQ
jgi:hypothetical protein